jgi:hypothetical protein
VVPADDCTVATLQSLLCPFINCCSRLKRDTAVVLPGTNTSKTPSSTNRALEGAGFEPSVPLWVLTVSGPPLVVYVTLPRFLFAENEIAFRD